MKYSAKIAIGASIVFPLLLFPQKNEPAISIGIKLLRTYPHSISLYKLNIFKNGKHVQEIKPEHNMQLSVVLPDTGHYSITYTSIFRKTETVAVHIREYKSYKATVYIDYLDYSKEKYIPVIDRLQENETFTIVRHSRGCFHFHRDTMHIHRTKSGYQVKYRDSEKQLSKSEIQRMREFELELNYMREALCTTQEHYVISYGDYRTEISDGGCEWNGFWNLRQELFPSPE